ncbi:hypothetical protein EW146_g6819 [Bondarzewia mesenterica]|uniref:Mediator of RNA polymerase II transcription subunit 12 n=1 Tax=Bondarzewia mesenterica TaxID=1095465 RepID=A0A4S4LMH2_9AGAM|nr:hypothetical protein EW146_g6819 [Bondarzewia mesenterica]
MPRARGRHLDGSKCEGRADLATFRFSKRSVVVPEIRMYRYWKKAETYTAQEVVNKRFYENAVSDLEDLMNQIFSRRAEAVPVIPSSSFRMPSRVTLNDAKRQAWFADLANPDVPLSKLGKSVPHGAKGHDLLDLLHTNNVAIPRAVWFLRVLGANETAGLRNKPAYDPTQYSVEWANLVTGYMKKQLGEISLPSAPRPGLNIKSSFKGVLSDSETRERWISRFTYCLNLLRSFYSEGLVDNRTFLSWLVMQMGMCNLAQAGFVARLADEYMDGIMSCRALTRPFVEACLVKISEIGTNTAKLHLPNLEQTLNIFVARCCINLPDAFISPRMWVAHSSLLSCILAGDACESPDAYLEQTKSFLRRTLYENYVEIKKRNDAMLFRNLPPRVLARLSEAVTDVMHLNSISVNTDLDTFPFFEPPTTDAQFALKVDRLLTWSVTPLQYGDHRPYAAVTLLKRWCDRAGDRATRRDYRCPDELLQDLLFDWLDSSGVAGEPENLHAVALLFGELVKRELFSYAKYIQRLIARCEPGLLYSAVWLAFAVEKSDIHRLYVALKEEASRHRGFLRWIPLHKSTSSIVNQRKVTLHGVRARETPEELNEREIRREIRLLIPGVFSESNESHPLQHSTGFSLSDLTTLLSSPRYEQVRTVRQWLLPLLVKVLPSRIPDPLHYQTQVSPHVQSQAVRSFCTAIDLMTQVKCYGSILDLSISMLDLAPFNVDLLIMLIETFRRFLSIWASMNVMKTIADALYATNNACKMRGLHSRALLTLMLDVDNGRHLDPNSRKLVESEMTSYAQALRAADGNPETVPTHLQEILLLPNDPRPGTAQMLANNLWYRYRTAPDWAWRVWDNTFASLRIKPQVPQDAATARARALLYAEFLLHIDEHLPHGLDEHVLNWFSGPGVAELIAIDADAWDCVMVALLYLTMQGALSTTTILQGLVYPMWQRALNPSSPAGVQAISQPPEVYLRAAHEIFARLMLRTEGSGDEIPPTDFLQSQRIRTRRQDVFADPHLLLLISNIPVLVFIENSSHIPEELRQLSSAIRHAVCDITEFRQGVYRDLNAVRDAFERWLQYDTLDEVLVEPLMDALRLILNVARTDTAAIGSSEWLDTSALLSPWKLAATAIEVQFGLKQMGERLALGTPHTHGKTKVDKLIAQFLHHHMTTEEADFVADMARGVGPTIVSKFVNMGLYTIAGILKKDRTPSQEVLNVVSERLRLLAHVVEPVRDDPLQLPMMDAPTQDEFFDVLAKKLEALVAILSHKGSEDGEMMSSTEATQAAVLMARLLQFDLAFRGVWTSKTRELSSKMCQIIFDLALVHGAGENLNPVAFPLFLDTFCYLLDEIMSDIKGPALDLFRNYPQLDLMQLPSDMPGEYRQHLRSLLPYCWPNEVVADLAYASRDAAGRIIVGAPVQNRPWEWVENLGDQPPGDAKDEKQAEERRVVSVKNTASLSLELFATRATGDAIVPSTARSHSNVEATIRSFHDNLSTESVFSRDWRESRINLSSDPLTGVVHARGEHEDEVGALPSFHSSQDAGRSNRRSTSRKPSPASSVRSRGSGRPSTSSSRRQSPATLSRASASGANDPTDVEAIGTSSTSGARASSSKRKASVSISDSDIEIIEDLSQVSQPQPTQKKTKTKAPAKLRAKKR